MSDRNEEKNDKVLVLINEVKMAEWELKFVEPRKNNRRQPGEALPQKAISQHNKRMGYFC